MQWKLIKNFYLHLKNKFPEFCLAQESCKESRNLWRKTYLRNDDVHRLSKFRSNGFLYNGRLGKSTDQKHVPNVVSFIRNSREIWGIQNALNMLQDKRKGKIYCTSLLHVTSTTEWSSDMIMKMLLKVNELNQNDAREEAAWQVIVA